uniref:Reverse transcriptase domain-containing protein n=1 Tax=Leptobrachium leishanense TaxID=445787 RepID=A0A8C5WCE6_9ANUR
METMLKERIVDHLKTHRLQDQKQHGFTSGRSCQTNLIDFFDWVTKIIDTGGAVDIAYLDFSKAFDTVPHRRLINKLQSLRLDSNIVDWIRQWLSDRQQRVVVNGVYWAQGLVTSGVPQGSVLGPILFNIFISDIAEGINGKVCLFADDTKICNRVDVPGGISQMTNDLGKLKKWSELWQLSFNVDKCKIMHLGRKNPRAEYRIFDTVLTSTSEERDLGVIISEGLRVSSQCDRAAGNAGRMLGNAGRMLGCVGRGISSRKREVLMPLYRALVRPHLEYCVQYWRPLFWHMWEPLICGNRRTSGDVSAAHIRGEPAMRMHDSSETRSLRLQPSVIVLGAGETQGIYQSGLHRDCFLLFAESISRWQDKHCIALAGPHTAVLCKQPACACMRAGVTNRRYACALLVVP